MPVYQLLGGKCRVAAPVYRHASGPTPEAVVERARSYLAEGYRHIRAQVAVRGQRTYGAGARDDADATPAHLREGDFAGSLFEPAAYQRAVPQLFEHLRRELGDEVELLHDLHERLHPVQAMEVAKALERFRLFFLEDPFAPEDVGYFRHLRAQCATPIAMGELFNNPQEWLDLVSGRLIDFIRCHLTQVGGITMGRKIAALCDFYRVRTAWHGPGDTCPIGHAANLHLDLSTWNFGIQEATNFGPRAREVFHGIDFDEALAARYPIRDDPPFDLEWGRLRDRDGTIRRP
jgi:mannonate dehydratase